MSQHKQQPQPQHGSVSHKKAVALKYTPQENQSPIVSAKGRGYVAEQIVERARQHGVPIQEDASLVEVLSKLDIEQEIPAELYQLVAELLSFIYRADRRAADGLRE